MSVSKKTIGIVCAVLGVVAAAVFILLYDSTPAPQTVQSDIQEARDKRLAKGDTDAPVSIIEYADVLCPGCAKASNEILPLIEKDYIDTKKAHLEVRLVAVISPDSERAAVGAYCAAEQDKFWEYIDTAYRETKLKYYDKNKGPSDIDMFSDTKINQFAARVGLDVASWRNCVDSGRYTEVLAKNRSTMSELKAYGTPHFMINGQGYNGAPAYVFFQKALDNEYKKATEAGK